MDKFCGFPLDRETWIPLKGGKLIAAYFPNLERLRTNAVFLTRERTPFQHWWKYLHTTQQPNNAGDWTEINASELQSANLQFQL